jgi:hypothetical protein
MKLMMSGLNTEFSVHASDFLKSFNSHMPLFIQSVDR